ncbi:MAG: hypothetical protein AAF750_05775 [Planctomycetota bacterium]
MSQASDPATQDLTYVLLITGGAEEYIAEAKLCLCSAFAELGEDRSGVRFRVVTDQAAAFEGWPVTVQPLDAEQFEAWKGEDRLFFRARIQLLRWLLETVGGPVVSIDTDVVFRRSPRLLAERIGPGRSVMHKAEGRPSLSLKAKRRSLVGRFPQQTVPGPDGRGYRFARAWRMWNAGVLGLHPTLVDRFDEALGVHDGVHKAFRTYTAEQIAMSYLLGTHSRVSTADDVIEHYYDGWSMLANGLSPRANYRLEAQRLFEAHPDADAETLIVAYRSRGLPVYRKTLTHRATDFARHRLGELRKRRG